LFEAPLAWVEGLRDDDRDTVAIDGNTSRFSRDWRRGRNPLVWAARQRMTARPIA
jgi:hypothetical protein